MIKIKEHRELIQKIKKLKKEKNAIILVHNYQRPEIYEIADLLGDSLELSRKAAVTDKETIVFCGVHFMAETAKILSPKKTVLLPEINAGCPMADMVDEVIIENLKRQYPKAAVACYVNTTAEVKAASDICVTSANAVKVITSLEQDQVIFVPDRNLAAYIQRHTKKQIIPFDGFCYVHQRFNSEEIAKAKAFHKDVYFIAHPECPPEVIDMADEITSTSGMILASKKVGVSEIFIGTETGMIERLKREVPDKTFYSAGRTKFCYNMKKTSLDSVYEALLYDQYQIKVPDEIISKARQCLDRMLKV